MNVTVTIKPGLSPMDRGWVEDQLAERLGGEEAVEFLGGGTMLGDPPVSDFELGVPEDRDPVQVAAVCREFLASIPFSITTTVTLEVGELEEEQIVVEGSES